MGRTKEKHDLQGEALKCFSGSEQHIGLATVCDTL